jgi:hypothetical protein
MDGCSLTLKREEHLIILFPFYLELGSAHLSTLFFGTVGLDADQSPSSFQYAF